MYMLIAKVSLGSSGETDVSSADVKRWQGWAMRWRLVAGRSRRGVHMDSHHNGHKL